jgi:hypothetical protein
MSKISMIGFRVTSKTGQLTSVSLDTSLKGCISDHFVIRAYVKQKNLYQKILEKLKLVPHPVKIDTNFTPNNQQRRFVNE